MAFRIFCIFLSLFSLLSAQALEVSTPFGDCMVLQQGCEVPVWGTAKPRAKVVVTFAEQSLSGEADSEGRWKVRLSPMKASAESRVLSVVSGEKKKEFTDVLVGEVWLGAGQSNMAGKVASYAKNDPTIAGLLEKAPYATIRLCMGGPKPQWKVADAGAVNGFSALLFAFGERLQQDLGVPVGMIVGAVGGTPSGAWMPGETFESSELCREEINSFAKSWDAEKAKTQFNAKLAVWEQRTGEAERRGEKPRGRKPKPPVDPGGMTRGGKVGNLFDRYIRSSHGFAIRGVLWDQGEAGSGIFGLGQYTSMTELIRGWRELWGQESLPFLFVQKPSGLGNAFTTENPVTREADKFVELPDIANASGGESRYLYTRLMLDNEDAWMVPAIDLGSTIHPINKWGYGNRSAEVALRKVYSKEVAAYGPVYRSHEVEGDKVTVQFDSADGGLTTAHTDSVRGFALLGSDGKWHWADAEIVDENSVLLASSEVPDPKQIRYAFAKDRRWANLFNGEGLPALAFTTEEIELPDR